MTNLKTRRFTNFLLAVDHLSEFELNDVIGDPNSTIFSETPGFYEDEKDDYPDIEDFYIANMGENGYKRLVNWYKKHPAEVQDIIKRGL